jgi:hypothetical protein
MAIPSKITVPKYPKFMPAPDQDGMELYIICTRPLALFWVRQTVPAQIYIVEGPQDRKLLRECGDFYRNMAANTLDKS